jgi:SMI1 / KNR4 family (SUKH-1)
MKGICVKTKTFFGDPRVKFAVIGETVSESEINLAIPESFQGKKKFIQFYLQHNGGVLQNSSFFYKDTFHEVPSGRAEVVEIADFHSIPGATTSEEDRSSICALQAAYRGKGLRSEMKTFLDAHLPLASNGCGDDCWIEFPSGRVRYFEHESAHRGPLAIIEIAPTFIDFVSNIVAELRDEDKIEGVDF